MSRGTSNMKPLGLRDGTLRLLPYQPQWPALFSQEATRIAHAVGPRATIEIHHIGSTAVEGLAAKPILDIALVVQPDKEEVVARSLVALGYRDRGERSGRLFVLEEGTGVRLHNLHLYAPDDERLREQIAFRDILRRDPQARDRYMQLKASLLGVERRDYAPAKTSFIAATLRC